MEVPYKAIRADSQSVYGKNAVIFKVNFARILNQESSSVKPMDYIFWGHTIKPCLLV